MDAIADAPADGSLAGRVRRAEVAAGVRPLVGRRAAVVAWLRSRDVAVGYAIVVLAVGVYVHTRPGRTAHRLVLESSTNLTNLRDNPLAVLAVSAFVVSSLPGLAVLPLLVAGYGAAQRWVGRTAAVVVGVLGHVGATLMVATLLVAGVRHGRLDPALTHAPDVGVSYGLLAVLGFLTARVPPGRRRLAWVVWLVGSTAAAVVYRDTFTDIGHVLALLLGFGLAAVAAAAARAQVSARTPTAPAPRARPDSEQPDGPQDRASPTP